MSNNLNLSQVAAAQHQKEVTINDQAGELDAAVTEQFEADVSAGNVALTAEQYRRAIWIKATGAATAGRTVTLQAIKRLVAIANFSETDSVDFVLGSATITLSAAAGADQPTGAVVYTDGTANGLYRVTPDLSTSEVIDAFTDLTDVPSAYTGHGGKYVKVTAGEDGLEFVAAAAQPYDFGFVKAETPTSAEVIGKVVIPRDITLPADFTGAAGHVDVNPDDAFDIDVTDDGTSIGTISIATDGSFTFTTDGNAAKSVAAGSVSRFVAPANTDATVAGIAVTLIGSLD
jgi:hypothetical protein